MREGEQTRHRNSAFLLPSGHRSAQVRLEVLQRSGGSVASTSEVPAPAPAPKWRGFSCDYWSLTGTGAFRRRTRLLRCGPHQRRCRPRTRRRNRQTDHPRSGRHRPPRRNSRLGRQGSSPRQSPRRVRRLLLRNGCPPDQQEEAILLVLKPAEALAGEAP